MIRSASYYDAATDAKNRQSYYAKVHVGEESPTQAFQELHDLVQETHTHPLAYKPSQHLYPQVDVHEDGKLHSIYAPGKTATAAELSEDDELHGEASGQYNCEHTVPQSWFGKHEPMRGDLHHLFACDVPCNSDRANGVYVDFPQVPEGDCGISSAQHNHFEPAAGKGAVARATLYFLLRYPGEIGDQSGEYTAGDVKTLLRWHQENPVTDYERHRNVEIEGKQGNRNPLIDHPEWTDKIDFVAGLGDWGKSHPETTPLPTQLLLECPVDREPGPWHREGGR